VSKTESPSTVLIVDDDEDCRRIYGLALEHAGYNVLTANDGHEGLRLAKFYEPDVILMDIAMPVMDGLAALRQLRSLGSTRDLPIVAVTAMATKHEVMDLSMSGFDELLTKPVAPNEIVAVVRRVLKPLS
jgi:CheY-like chemotaxis protein